MLRIRRTPCISSWLVAFKRPTIEIEISTVRKTMYGEVGSDERSSLKASTFEYNSSNTADPKTLENTAKHFLGGAKRPKA